MSNTDNNEPNKRLPTPAYFASAFDYEGTGGTGQTPDGALNDYFAKRAEDEIDRYTDLQTTSGTISVQVYRVDGITPGDEGDSGECTWELGDFVECREYTWCIEPNQDESGMGHFKFFPVYTDTDRLDYLLKFISIEDVGDEDCIIGIHVANERMEEEMRPAVEDWHQDLRDVIDRAMATEGGASAANGGPPPAAAVCPFADGVARSIVARAEKGREKYGVTCERTDLDLHQWLTHLQEELMDACVYIERNLYELSLENQDTKERPGPNQRDWLTHLQERARHELLHQTQKTK